MNTARLTDSDLKAAASVVAQRNAELLRNADVEGVSFSEEFEAKMAALFEKARVIERKLLIRKRIVVAVIAALITALTACACIPGIRERVYKAVVTHFNGFFKLQYVQNNNEETTAFQSLVAQRLSNIPEGYVFTFEICNDTIFSITYTSEDGYISLYQEHVGTSSPSIDNEKVEISTVYVNGHKAMAVMLTDTDYPMGMLLWQDGVYQYELTGTLTLSELIKVAESAGKS